MTGRTVQLIRQSFPDRPAFDTAVSRALLMEASDGRRRETLRLHLPGDIVAFGRQDVVSDGYVEAVRAARRGGFAPVERLAGGRAAVFHPRTVAFSWAVPDPSPRRAIQARFREIADVVVGALRRLGVDARVGEVPLEYCPGTYSVNARGERKLMGVGQRLARRAAHVGGVIVIGDARRVRDILVPVYDALRLRWDPDTVGSVEDEVGPVGWEQAEAALVDELASRHRLVEVDLPAETLEAAARLEAEHRSP